MLFSKKIKVKEEELQEYFCVKHKKSGKKVYLNTELIVPENCVCVFCYKTKPCDVLQVGEYQLNGNSLPLLYKKGNFNKPNKRNYIPNYFFANIWFASTNNFWLDFDIDKFVVKDRVYGKQKICLSMKINIKLNDATKFFKTLLYERPHISKRKVIGEIIYWFETDIRKFLKRQGYNIDDFMCYTRGFNQELHSLLCDRFVNTGIEIIETSLEDIIMDDELVREINDNRNLSYQIHSSLKDFDIAMNNDGVKTQVNFERSGEQLEGSIAQKYATPKKDDSVQMENCEEASPFSFNQNNDNYQTNKFEEIKSGMNVLDNNPYLKSLNTDIDVMQSISTTFGVTNESAVQNKVQNNNDYIINQNGTNNLNNDKDLQDMYNMADETFDEQTDSYSALYGNSSAFKICENCGKQVPMYASFCPYCGNNNFKHNL